MVERVPPAADGPIDTGQGHQAAPVPPPGHETGDVNARAAILSIGGLAVLVGVAALFLIWLFHLYSTEGAARKASDFPLLREERAEHPRPQDRLPNPAEPRLEGIDPYIGPDPGVPPNWPEVPLRSGAPGWESNAQALSLRDRRTLDSYGWVDRDKGVARIPIERAMELVAERLSARGKP